mgnify:CR=1 FL=1
MPIQPSPFAAVPNFLQRPADPRTMPGAQSPGGQPDLVSLLAMLGAQQGGQGGAMVPQPPPDQSMPPAGTTPPGMSQGMAPPSPGGGGAASAPPEMDIFQRVVSLLLSHPMMLPIFAGMGLRDALEKAGKFSTKPHRSNEELASQGYNVGNPGQTGMAAPGELVRQLSPGMPPG